MIPPAIAALYVFIGLAFIIGDIATIALYKRRKRRRSEELQRDIDKILKR